MSELKTKKEKLEEFKTLLQNWNRTHNLISKKESSNLDEHINDSLTIIPFLSQTIIDMGSGGGLPGLPIAITDPQKQVYLVESSQKKSSFLFHAINKLSLKNTIVINERIELIDPLSLEGPFQIISRAFGTTNSAIRAAKRFLETRGSSLELMKTSPFEEGEKIHKGYVLIKKQKIDLKGKDKGRLLVTIKREREKK